MPRKTATQLATEIEVLRAEFQALDKLDDPDEDDLSRSDEILTEIQSLKPVHDKAVQREAQVEAVRSLALGGQTDTVTRGGAKVTHEPMTYNRYNNNSYFLDIARAEIRRDREAMDRLQRHAKELEVELPARAKARDEIARSQLHTIDGLAGERGAQARESAFEISRVNPNRTDGQGGYHVPPLWLIDESIGLPRFGRPLANAVRNLTLPSGTDSINLPKIATGTSTAAQTADNAAVTSVDLTDTFVNAPVRTIAGQQDVAIQLLDQSPAGFDQIVMGDLQADYAVTLDTQCWNGSGASGQVTGVLNASGANAITYTDASVTFPEMWPFFPQAASLIAKNRKMPATATFMIPSVWYWIAGSLDTANRPMIQIENGTGFNILALQTGVQAEGPAGRIMGLPVILDGNIPTTLGGGTETRVVTLRTSDIYLWEGQMRTRVLSEVLSGTLQVRFQIYNYVAFMPDRLPKAISIGSGTGFIPQSGY